MSQEIYMSLQDERLHQTEMIVKRQIERVQNILDEQMTKTAGLIEKQMERARSFLNQKQKEHNITKSSDASADVSRNKDTGESRYQSTSDKIQTCQEEFEDIIGNGFDQTKHEIISVVQFCSHCGSDITQSKIKEDIQNADTIGKRLVQDPRYQTETNSKNTTVDSHDNNIAWRRLGGTQSPAVANVGCQHTGNGETLVNTQRQKSITEKHHHEANKFIRLNPTDGNDDPSQYDYTDPNIIRDDTRQSAIVNNRFRRLTNDRQHVKDQAIHTMYSREPHFASRSSHNNTVDRSLRVVEREVAISASTTCNKNGHQPACKHNKHSRKSRHKSTSDVPLTSDVDRICSADSRRRKFASQKLARMTNVTRAPDDNCRMSNKKHLLQETRPSHIPNGVAESLGDTQEIMDKEPCVKILGLESKLTTKPMLVEDDTLKLDHMTTPDDFTNRVVEATSFCSSNIEVEVPKSAFASRYEHTIIEDKTVETKSVFKYNSDDVTQSVDTVYIDATMNSRNSEIIRNEVEIDDVIVRQTTESEQITYCPPVVNVPSEVIGEERNTDNNNIAYAGHHNTSMFDVVVSETVQDLDCDRNMDAKPTQIFIDPEPLDCAQEMDERPVVDVVIVPEITPLDCAHETENKPKVDVITVPDNASLDCAHGMDDIYVVDVVVPETAPLDYEHEHDARPVPNTDVPESAPLCCELQTNARPAFDVETVSKTAPLLRCEVETDAIPVIDVVVYENKPLDCESEMDARPVQDDVLLKTTHLDCELEIDARPVPDVIIPDTAPLDSEHEVDCNPVPDVVVPDTAPLDCEVDGRTVLADDGREISILYCEPETDTKPYKHTIKSTYQDDSCNNEDSLTNYGIDPVGIPSLGFKSDEEVHTNEQREYTKELNGEVDVATTVNIIAEKEIIVIEDACSTFNREKGQYIIINSNTEINEDQAYTTSELNYRITSEGTVDTIQVIDNDSLTQTTNTLGDSSLYSEAESLEGDGLDNTYIRDGHGTFQVRASFAKEDTERQQQQSGEAEETTSRVTESNGPKDDIGDKVTKSKDMVRITDSIDLEEVDSSFYERERDTDRHSISSTQLSLEFEDTDQYSFTGVSLAVDGHVGDSEQPEAAPLDYYTDISASLSQALHCFSDIVHIKSYNFGDDQLSEPVMQMLRRNRKIKRLHRKGTAINRINLKSENTVTSISSKSYRSSHSNVRLGGLGPSNVDSGSSNTKSMSIRELYISQDAPGRPRESHTDTYVDEDTHNGDEEASTTVNSSILHDELENLTDVEDPFTPDDNESSNKTDLLGTSSDTFTRIENPDYRH